MGFNVLGVVSLLLTILLAFWVYRLQHKESSQWQNTDSQWKGDLNGEIGKVDAAVGRIDTAIADLDDAVRNVAESVARLEQDRIDADLTEDLDSLIGSTTPSPPENPDVTPVDVGAYIQALKASKIPLDYDALHWRKKVRCDGGRGNMGWFVDDGGTKRFFIHRGRGISIREAVPRPLLEAWERETDKEPCEIELDFQTGVGRGNHSWYVRTFSGQTWRLSAGGNGKTDPTVALMETD